MKSKATLLFLTLVAINAHHSTTVFYSCFPTLVQLLEVNEYVLIGLSRLQKHFYISGGDGGITHHLNRPYKSHLALESSVIVTLKTEQHCVEYTKEIYTMTDVQHI